MKVRRSFDRVKFKVEAAGRGHAVVVGGSLAGLLAARVLLNHFERVTVVERDSLPDGPAPRKGVPQSRHLHALMPRGQMILEELFPGLREEMLADGALSLDMAADIAWLTPGGWGARFRSGLELLSSTRDLLDAHVRRRVAALPRVRFAQECEVLRLLPSDDGRGVRGVRICLRHDEDDEYEPAIHDLPAELVIDASGRGSRASRWLEQLGYAPPAQSVVSAYLGYASRLYRRPAGTDADWRALYVQAAPPERTRAGILFPVEGDRWLVTLSGGGRDYPPTDEEGFLEFARSLPSPLLYDAIRDAEPLTQPTPFRATENRRRHFERLARRPENFLVTGDAACAFNPVYGQGMTTAALGALALEESLRERQTRGGRAGLAASFQTRLAKVNAAPWLLATGEDLRYREAAGGSAKLSTRLTHRYMDSVVKLSTRDEGVRLRLLKVFGMLERPPALFRPGVASRVLAGSLAPRTRVRWRERVTRTAATSEACL